MKVVCHVCGGGRTGERSCDLFEVDGGVVMYKCYRASCPRPSGIYSGTVVEVAKRKQMQLPSIHTLPHAKRRWLANKYHLSDKDLARLRPMYTATDRYWYPIFDEDGEQVGGVARSYTSKPKSLTYAEDHCGSWYGKPSSCVWLVEDQVSACKLAEYTQCVALLGAAVPVSLYAKLPKCVKIALDADALDRAVVMSQRLQSRGHEVQVVHLSRDIKDMYHDQIEILVGGACGKDE